MDIPNAITASRFAMAVVGSLALLVLPSPIAHPVGLVIFAAAALSDWLDGILARKLGRYSPLGAFMDPLADKVIIYMYFAYLTYLGTYPLWLFMALLARDLMHDAYRAYAASMRASMPANLPSKIKTALQMFSIIFVLAALCLNQALLLNIGVLLMLVALIAGIAGALKTLSDHKRFFSLGE